MSPSANPTGNSSIGRSEERPLLPRWLLPGAIISAGLVIGFYIWNFRGGLTSSQDIWGQFGDYTGGILNPIIAFLALVALLQSIRIQGRELQFSTRELRNSAEALKGQVEALAQQNYESTLFQLLGLLNSLTSSLTYHGSNWSRSGQEGFNHVSQESLGIYKSNKNRVGTEEAAATALAKAFESHGSQIGPYLESFHLILQYIDNGHEPKHHYADILRAQTSHGQLLLVFLYGLQHPDLKKLLLRYGMLRNLHEYSRLKGHQEILELYA